MTHTFDDGLGVQEWIVADCCPLMMVLGSNKDTSPDASEPASMPNCTLRAKVSQLRYMLNLTCADTG